MVWNARSVAALIVKILLGIVLFLVVLVGALLLYIGSSYFSAKAGTWLTHQSGRNVVLEGHVETHLWRREPRIIVSGVRVGNAEWSATPTMFEAERIEFSLRPWELLRGRLVLPDLILDRPKLLLEKNAKGDANWHFGQNPQASVVKKPAPQSRFDVPIIRRLAIHDGQVSYRDPAKHIVTTLKVSTANGNLSEDEDITFSGDGTYQNQPFTLEIHAASILELRETHDPYPFHIKTRIGPTSAEVQGTATDPIKLENFDVTLDLKGANAADLFLVTGIALPPTPPYEVRGHLTRNGKRWDFRQFAGRLGTSDLKGDVLWHPDQKPPYFEGDFVSDNLDMKDLAGFVGGHRKPEDPNRVLPDAPLDISRLLAMDADATFHGRHIKAPALLDDFFMRISLKGGVLTLKPVSFDLAQGEISADVTVEGRKEPPRAKLDVRFSHLSLSDLFAPLAARFGKHNVSAGVLGGRAILEGTGKSLRDILATSDGTIGLGMEGGQLSHLLLDLIGLDLFRSAGLLLGGDEPVAMRCVVGNFAVSSGVMRPNTILIDTDVTSIEGQGSVNLRTEGLNLRFMAHPKEASLFSARSPILLHGTFKHPSVGVDAVALAARGGAATLLGLLAPPAALVAFLQPGLGEKSHCVAFVSQLNRDTGTTVGAKKSPAKDPYPHPGKKD